MKYTPTIRSAALADTESKIFDDAIPWDKIDKEKALAKPHALDLVREACLVESYFAVYTGKMMRLFWYDIEATTIYSIEAFEAYTHFYKLRRYLDEVGYKPVTDDDIRAVREEDLHVEYKDEIRELVNFMGTEHFASNFFSDLAKEIDEPVLRDILPRMAREEVTHAAFATDLLKSRLAADPSIRDQIMEHAANFLHVGKYVMPELKNAREDPVSMIQDFGGHIEELTGISLTEYMRNKNR